ncbi:hypothetical protein [Amycolatopsis thermoflava]|uniref:hypothetical protein n=1 Tax=Amycolatopsis thermoflava TaxID=84480 RepID=UPI0004035A45|nr:hypothetical protein [Amycolatopsis thermoflava]
MTDSWVRATDPPSLWVEVLRKRVPIALPSFHLPRTDLVTMMWDWQAPGTTLRVEVFQGHVSSAAAPPECPQDRTPLAHVLVRPNTTGITADDITPVEGP